MNNIILHNGISRVHIKIKVLISNRIINNMDNRLINVSRIMKDSRIIMDIRVSNRISRIILNRILIKHHNKLILHSRILILNRLILNRHQNRLTLSKKLNRLILNKHHNKHILNKEHKIPILNKHLNNIPNNLIQTLLLTNLNPKT